MYLELSRWPCFHMDLASSTHAMPDSRRVGVSPLQQPVPRSKGAFSLCDKCASGTRLGCTGVHWNTVALASVRRQSQEHLFCRADVAQVVHDGHIPLHTAARRLRALRRQRGNGRCSCHTGHRNLHTHLQRAGDAVRSSGAHRCSCVRARFLKANLCREGLPASSGGGVHREIAAVKLPHHTHLLWLRRANLLVLVHQLEVDLEVLATGHSPLVCAQEDRA
mmetsp:Transcript_25481/g.58765  ORF Transcript_25481/g.58765 Transcript_25481/m.58765 type:complete len:221 (-) Transcript_25481:530-1192(-)